MKKVVAVLMAVMFVGAFLGTMAVAQQAKYNENVIAKWIGDREWSRSALWNPGAVKLMDCERFKKKPPWKIGFANAAKSNTYGIYTELQFRQRAEKYIEQGLISEVMWTDAQDRPDKQISDIEDMLVKGIDLLVIRACTEAALDPIVTRLDKQNFPVICFARRVKSVSSGSSAVMSSTNNTRSATLINSGSQLSM